MPLKALVVDNNPVLQTAISALLEKEGCQVATADDGLQALEHIRSQVPDILFTDLVMPLVDGGQLCKILKNTEEYQDIFIVVVSAIVFEEEERILDTIACDLFIAKGSLVEMKSHLQEALRLYRQREHGGGRLLGGAIEAGVSRRQSITSEILAEKKHREDIVACLSEGVIELNHQGKIVEINQAALDILDRREEQVIGLGLESLGWGEHDGAVQTWVISELQNKGMTPLRCGDDSPVFRQGKVLTMTLLPIAASTHFGICILSDISRQYTAEQYNKKLEASLRQLKKMEAMSGMAGGMAHDFNNLLTVICGNIDILRLRLQQTIGDDSAQLLAQAKESALTAVELVRKISDFSPYGVVEKHLHDLVEVVQEAVNSLEDAGGCQVRVAGDGKDAYNAMVDRKQLVIALRNIFQNSMDAGAGRVDASIRPVALEDPIVEHGQYVPAGSYIRIAIEDNGRGIEPENLSLIFDPYFTSKPRGSLKGMGLGLAVVYTTVRNHNGYIVVDSVIGERTEVSIFLPWSDSMPDTRIFRVTHGVDNRGHLLIIEGEPGSRQVGTVLLEYLGYAVLAGGNLPDLKGELTSLKERGECLAAALVSIPDLDGAAGVDMCSELHEYDQNLKVVAVSSTLAEPIVKAYKQHGFAGVLLKPYSVEDLKNLLAGL